MSPNKVSMAPPRNGRPTKHQDQDGGLTGGQGFDNGNFHSHQQTTTVNRNVQELYAQQQQFVAAPKKKKKKKKKPAQESQWGFAEEPSNEPPDYDQDKI